jgi:hypothetical protein
VFSAGHGITQSGPFSPHTFNVVLDGVIRDWLYKMLGTEAARQGLGNLAQTKMIAF